MNASGETAPGGTGTLLGTPNPAGTGRGWLWAALALGLLRFLHLGQWSLWFDEAATVSDAWHGMDPSNPLGYGIIRLFADLLDSRSPQVLRFPAAAAGWLCIPLSWWAFRPILGERRSTLVALLVAASPWALYWSQNARFYTMAGALTLTGTGLFIRGIMAGRLLDTLIALAVVLSAAGFHLTAVPYCAALIAAAWLARLPNPAGITLRPLILVGGLVLLIASPWVWSSFAGFIRAKETAGWESLRLLILSTGYSLTPTIGLAALIGGCACYRSSPWGRMLLFIPVLGGLLASSAALLATSSAQYVFVFLPAICALAAWPLDSNPASHAAPNLSRKAQALWLALTLLPSLWGSTAYFTHHHGQRPRYREAYALAQESLEAEAPKTGRILGMQAAVGEFYLAPLNTALRWPIKVESLSRYQPGQWKRVLAEPGPVWIVLRPAFLDLWAPRPRMNFLKTLENDCQLIERFQVSMVGRDLDVELWLRPE